jgi:hypothetical protein
MKIVGNRKIKIVENIEYRFGRPSFAFQKPTIDFIVLLTSAIDLNCLVFLSETYN